MSILQKFSKNFDKLCQVRRIFDLSIQDKLEILRVCQVKSSSKFGTTCQVKSSQVGEIPCKESIEYTGRNFSIDGGGTGRGTLQKFYRWLMGGGGNGYTEGTLQFWAAEKTKR